VADFVTIGSGGTVQSNVRVDGGSNFIVFDIAASFQLNGAFSNAIDGTPLALSSNGVGATGTAATSNNMPSLAQVRAMIQTQDRPWMNIPIRADALVSNALSRNFLAKQPMVAGNDVIQVTVYNDGPATIKGQIAFIGAKILPSN
jgi:hypothetical protein